MCVACELAQQPLPLGGRLISYPRWSERPSCEGRVAGAAWSWRGVLPPQRSHWPGWRPLPPPPAPHTGCGTRQGCLAPSETAAAPTLTGLCPGCVVQCRSLPQRCVLRGLRIGRRDGDCPGRHRGISIMPPGLGGRGVGGRGGDLARTPHLCGGRFDVLRKATQQPVLLGAFGGCAQRGLRCLVRHGPRLVPPELP